MKLSLILVFLFFACVFGYTKDYTGHVVIRCNVEDKDLFVEIMNYTEENLIDVWKANQINGEIDINFSNQQFTLFNNKFASRNMKCENMIDDLQKAILDEARQIENSKADPFFNTYRTYDEMLQFMVNLQKQYSWLYLVTIGNTTEGRTIYGIELNGGGDRRKKDGEVPTIYFQGMQHAREWIAPTTVLYILSKLAENYATNTTIQRIVDDINWVFIPVVNIDGYAYTISNDRLWRKNRRRPPTGSSCYGVDTNRNWPSYWNRGGSSTNPCSETYMGPSAASEVEVQTIMSYFANNVSNVVISTDWHSYSQLYITPWAWSTQSPPQLSAMTALGNKYAAAVRATSGMTYQVGSTAQILYVASGSFNDWQYDQYGVIYTQCIELRDTGRYGFILPADQIVPTGEENYAGVVVQALEILGNTPKYLGRKN